jgi:putative membrane protein
MNKFKQFLYNHKQQISVVLTAVFLTLGVLQYLIGWQYVLKLTPLVIGIITALVVLFWDINYMQRLKASIVAILIGFTAEVIGVNTGLLFGEYQYSNQALGLKILGVPILVGIMWLLVSASAWQIALLGNFNKWLTVILASAITVMFDLVLEQYATAYGLWTWQGGEIPLLNYVSWFFVSMLIFVCFKFIIKDNKVSLYGVSALPIMMIYFWLMLIFT